MSEINAISPEKDVESLARLLDGTGAVKATIHGRQAVIQGTYSISLTPLRPSYSVRAHDISSDSAEVHTPLAGGEMKELIERVEWEKWPID